MKKTTKALVYLFLPLIVSCVNRNNKEITLNINHIITPKTLISSNEGISSIVKECKIIEFESTKGSMISNIYKIEFIDDRFYVLDKESFSFGGKLLVFDEQGKFIQQIGNVGRAQNEHLSLGGFAINRQKGEIVILDDTAQKLIFFDMVGKFKRSMNLDFTARQIEILQDGSFVFAVGGKNNNRLIIADNQGVVKNSYFSPNEKNSFVMLNFFTKSGDDIIYRNYLNDTIYTINTKEGLFASKFVDFGEDAFTWDKFKSFSNSKRSNIESFLSGYSCNLKYYSETDRFVWSLFFASGKPQCMLYDKTTQKTIIYEVNKKNDITYDNFVPLVIGSNNEWFIAQNDPYSIKTYLNDNESANSDREQQIRDIINKRGDNCNPIISLIKFHNIK